MNRHDDWWIKKAKHSDIASKSLKLQDCLHAVIPHLNPAIKEGSRILDFGCGVGRLTVPMAEYYKNALLVGYDIAEKFLDNAQLEAEKRDVDCLFISKLDTTIKFDAAYSMLVLQHLNYQAKSQMIRKVASLLKKHGLFRFQYVEGGNDSFLTHDIKHNEVDKICAEAGLYIIDREFNLLEPRWTWITAIKGEL